ncbi:hypothetical protein HMPREF3232_01175 [Fannyhessea vaginae]|nr:hypothetical protein HMPREF3232_01175 [Fannyhessea vaginae]
MRIVACIFSNACNSQLLWIQNVRFIGWWVIPNKCLHFDW